jgi:hypothetical protein
MLNSLAFSQFIGMSHHTILIVRTLSKDQMCKLRPSMARKLIEKRAVMALIGNLNNSRHRLLGGILWGKWGIACAKMIPIQIQSFKKYLILVRSDSLIICFKLLILRLGVHWEPVPLSTVYESVWLSEPESIQRSDLDWRDESNQTQLASWMGFR